MSEARDAYVQKLKAKIDEWNADIDKLIAKREQAEADAKIKYQLELEELRAKRQDLEDKIEDLQGAGESAWEELKEGVESSWESWKEGFSKAKTAFEDEYHKGQQSGSGKKKG